MDTNTSLTNKIFLAWLLLAMLASCSETHRMDERMTEIKEMGDTAPMAALQAYDSMRKDIPSHDERIQSKYTLLGIRLRDKADIPSTSDSCAKEVVRYFERHGSNRDRQEAYYYAGSVYRDLQDTPRSLEYFLKSADCSETGEVDSLMLRNCYSQLYAQYFNVQDYGNALEAARRECYISKAANNENDISLIDLAFAYIRTDSTRLAQETMYRILDNQSRLTNNRRNADVLYDLLCSFSTPGTQDTAKATLCFSLLSAMRASADSGSRRNAVAAYFRATGRNDSCTKYYKLALEEGGELSKYEASKRLFYLYDSLGSKDQALKYARKHISISEELDLGKRQEQAATANNQYQYYKNKEEETRLKAERERAWMYLWISLTALTALTFAAYALHTHRKHKRIRHLMAISSTQAQEENNDKQAHDDEQALMEQIREKAETNKREREKMRNDLAVAESVQQRKEARIKALATDIEDLKKVQESLEMKISSKEEEVEKLMKTNSTLLRQTRKTELTKSQKDIMEMMERAERGQYTLTEEDWNLFAAVVDQKYPSLCEYLVNVLDIQKNEQERVCYLLVAGFSPKSMQYILSDISRSTLYNWCKKYARGVQEFLSQDIP